MRCVAKPKDVNLRHIFSFHLKRRQRGKGTQRLQPGNAVIAGSQDVDISSLGFGPEI